jgi:hypothetical protein
MVMMLIRLPQLIVLMVWMIRYSFASMPVRTIPNDLMKRVNNTTKVPFNTCKHVERKT